MGSVVVVVLLTGSAAVLPSAAAEERTVTPGRNEQALLDFFRRLTLTAADNDRLARLIDELDSPSYKKREKASAALVLEGRRALPVLRKAMAGATLERRLRLEKCVKALDSPQWVETIAEAVAQVHRTRPAGAEDVLLAYAPYAPDEMLDDVVAALCRLASRQARADDRYLAALADVAPARRGAAATVVGAFGTAAQRDRVARLLVDTDPLVRLRAAHGLLLGRDPRGIPVLIALLGASEIGVADRAEAILVALADREAPKVQLADQAKCVAAWEAWWKEHRAGLDLTTAAVTLGAADGPRQARRVAEEFFAALLTDNLPLLSKSVEVPFNLSHQQLFTTRESFEAFYGPVLKNNIRASNGSFKTRILRVVDAKEQHGLCVTRRDKDYVQQLGQGRAVFIHLILYYGPGLQIQERYTLVVRYSAGRARVAGFLEFVSQEEQ